MNFYSNTKSTRQKKMTSLNMRQLINNRVVTSDGKTGISYGPDDKVTRARLNFPINTSYQHNQSAHPINPFYQYVLSTCHVIVTYQHLHQPTVPSHSLNPPSPAPYQQTLSTPYQPTLSSPLTTHHPLNTLSTRSLDSLSHQSLSIHTSGSLNRTAFDVLHKQISYELGETYLSLSGRSSVISHRSTHFIQ